MKKVNNFNVTEDYIDNLIFCEKKVISRRKTQPKKSGKSYISQYQLENASGENFIMRIRVHSEFRNNFSVILSYIDEADNDIILMRCNGPHQNLARNNYDAITHIHRLTAKDWSNGSFKNPPFLCEASYAADVNKALNFFRNYCNIEGDDRFFLFQFPNMRYQSEDIDDNITENQISFDDLLGRSK